MTMKRTRERGTTLTEILLALIVLVLGVMGILALFPTALQQATESMEDTVSGTISQSLGQAMVNAMQFSTYDKVSDTWVVTFTHDLGAGGSKVRYTFTLPKLTDGWKHYPSGVPPPPADVGSIVPTDYEASNLLFHMGQDDWTFSTVETVKAVNDPSDSYQQLAFSFDVKKINTVEHLINPVPLPKPGAAGGFYTIADLEPLTRLYEFEFHIYRVAKQEGMFQGGGGSATQAGEGIEIRRVLHSVVKRISL